MDLAVTPTSHTAADYAASARKRLSAIRCDAAGPVGLPAIETAKAEALVSIAESLLSIEHLLAVDAEARSHKIVLT